MLGDLHYNSFFKDPARAALFFTTKGRDVTSLGQTSSYSSLLMVSIKVVDFVVSLVLTLFPIETMSQPYSPYNIVEAILIQSVTALSTMGRVRLTTQYRSRRAYE